MRPIKELIWHCTATPEGREHTVADIKAWHKKRGFTTIGYHKVVHLDGTVSEGRPEGQVGAHVAGRNTGTLGYCYVGGMSADMKSPRDTRTPAQKATMQRLTREAIARYRLTQVSGHRDYSSKACPSFDARREYAPLLSIRAVVAERDIGMPEADPQGSVNAKAQRGTAAGAIGLTSLAENAPTFAYQMQDAQYQLSAGTVLGTLVGVVMTAYALYQLDGWLGSPVTNWIKARLGR